MRGQRAALTRPCTSPPAHSSSQHPPPLFLPPPPFTYLCITHGSLNMWSIPPGISEFYYRNFEKDFRGKEEKEEGSGGGRNLRIVFLSPHLDNEGINS